MCYIKKREYLFYYLIFDNPYPEVVEMYEAKKNNILLNENLVGLELSWEWDQSGFDVINLEIKDIHFFKIID